MVITGASHGIGAAVALDAAKDGFSICLNYKGEDTRVKKIAQMINDGGGKAVCVSADIADPSEVEKLFEASAQELGPVSALVNNASRYGARASIDSQDIRDIQDTISVTLLGAIFCMRAAIKQMSFSWGGEGGAIVNISSNVVNTGGYNLAPYVAAKGGIEAVTRALAQEVGKDGIRINTVSPGAIDTEATARAGSAWRSRQELQVPLGRIGTPNEVANAILWLLSDDASYITGAIVPITGGRL